MKVYLQCLRKHNNEHNLCVSESKSYLHCRMNEGLMARQELEELGFGKEGEDRTRGGFQDSEGEKEKGGFVAGKHIKERKKGGRWGFWGGGGSR